MKNNIGIWLDSRKAEIFTYKSLEENPEVQVIRSNINESKPHGGSRSKQPYGPMDTVSESKFTEKRKHQEADFFENIFKALPEVKDLYIFGPSVTKQKFAAYLKETPQGRNLKLIVENSDHPTQNQKQAEIREHYVLKFKKAHLHI